MSGQQLIDGQTDAALESARRAVSMAGGLTEAHYQLGLVLARREDWRNAAAAFDRAAEIRPSHAYAHYYGGLMHYRANRLDGDVPYAVEIQRRLGSRLRDHR